MGSTGAGTLGPWTWSLVIGTAWRLQFHGRETVRGTGQMKKEYYTSRQALIEPLGFAGARPFWHARPEGACGASRSGLLLHGETRRSPRSVDSCCRFACSTFEIRPHNFPDQGVSWPPCWPVARLLSTMHPISGPRYCSSPMRLQTVACGRAAEQPPTHCSDDESRAVLSLGVKLHEDLTPQPTCFPDDSTPSPSVRQLQAGAVRWDMQRRWPQSLRIKPAYR